MYFRRHQEAWKIRPNNACLLENPLESDIQNIYSFCENFNDRLSQFVFISMQISKMLKRQESPIIIDSQQNLNMIIQILKQQKFVFLDLISQTRFSYKGYVSWIIIGTNIRLYLIDAAKLHDKCHQLKTALERKNLIKYMHECQQVIFGFKRDWQIFIPNIFDIQVVQRYMNKKGKSALQPKSNLKQFLLTNSNKINTRPINSQLLKEVQQYYENQIEILMNLDKFFMSNDPQYQCYAYFNHYQFLLKSYFHHKLSIKQMDKLQKMKKELCAFDKYGEHKQINLLIASEKQNVYWMKQKEQAQIAQFLCDWRQHIAKMRDINCEQILSYKVLSVLSKTKINSILQISQICNSFNSTNQTIYNLSLQDLQQIFQLFQLYKQQKQQEMHSLAIPRKLPYYKPNQQKPIKELLEQLKFKDQANQWLNKKTDQSVRLYKEIVSINQFDNSIVEEYMKQIIKNTNFSFKSQDVNKYIKYAQFFRLGNHKRLQELYLKYKANQNQANKPQQEYFQDNFIQGYNQYKNWDQIQQELDFPTMDTINQVKSNQSLTSLKNLSNIEVQSCKTLFNPKSNSILKDKKLNSLNLLQSPSLYNKIEALPQNIEAIYLQAAKAKKNYVAKGQKKTNKTNKKQSKQLIQSGSKKQEEFIPKKQQIFNLIYY